MLTTADFHEKCPPYPPRESPSKSRANSYTSIRWAAIVLSLASHKQYCFTQFI